MNKFIAFEGCDRVGKETQLNMLKSTLSDMGYKVKSYSFPNYGQSPIADIIDALLHDHSVFPEYDPLVAELLFTADKQKANKSILRDLEEGNIVLADRHYYSGLAYAMAKGLSLDWAMNMRRYLRIPEISFWLDVTPKEHVKRLARSVMLDTYEASEVMQSKVRYAYLSLATAYDNICRIDADNSPEKVHELILSELKRRKII